MTVTPILVADEEEEFGFTDHLGVACETQPWCKGIKDSAEFASDPIGTATNGAFESFKEAIDAGIAEMVTFLATMWDKVPTPNVTGESEAADTSRSAGALSITTVLDYTMYIGFALVMASVIAIGAMMAVKLRQGESLSLTGRLATTLLGAVLIGAAGSIAGAIGKQITLTGSSTIVFIQDELFWVAIAIVVTSIIVGGIRMAMDQQGRHGIELAKSLGTFIVVAGAGTTAVSMLILAGNEISTSLLDSSLHCSGSTGKSCFGEGFARVLHFDPTGQTGWDQMGFFWTLILGLILGIVGLVQTALMFLRNIIIAALLGFLIVAAAGTNMKVGKQMWEKYTGWMLAFVLYKPAAAAIYATAFYPITDLGSDDGRATEMVDQFWGAVGGIVLLVLAVLVLPALMRLMVPATSAMMGAAGGGMAGAMLASGAMTVATGAKTVASGSSAKAAQASTSAARNSPATMQERSGKPPQAIAPSAQSNPTDGAGPTNGPPPTNSTDGAGPTNSSSPGQPPHSNGNGNEPTADAGHDSQSGPSGTDRSGGNWRHGQQPTNFSDFIRDEITGLDDDEQEDGPDGSKR